jgi:transposase
MEKKNKLINKIRCLVRRAKLPRWLHHFGPKKYEFWQHAVALIIKQECKLGYRRVSRLLRWLNVDVPSYSAIAKMANRIPVSIWQVLLKMTAQNKLNLVAIDGSGMSRPLPSPYYYRRIDKPYPTEVPLKLSIAIDTRTKKILALRLRAKNRHDIKDAKFLIRNLPSIPRCIIADKGYDAEWLHQYCKDRGSKAIIPAKIHAKLRGFNLRKKCTDNFRMRTYHRREMVESTFSSIKRKFGASVSSVKISAQRAEIYCRAIAHNIISEFLRDFQRSR